MSPDEHWLAFTEWVLPKARVFEELSPYEYPIRVATMDLNTGEIIRHAIESLPPDPLGFSSSDKEWKGRAGLELIKHRLRPPGWRGNYFYLQPYYYGVYVAMDRSVPGLQILANPNAPGECSDCPPLTSVEFRGRVWDLLSKDVAAVFEGGVVRCLYFRGESPRINMILRLRDVGEEEVVVKRKEKQGAMVSIARVRVSPDGRYLAYVVYTKGLGFLDGPSEELFIRDLARGREKKIATYGYMSNLIWSPGGERLYFAGGEYQTDTAVRIVDVAATFPK